MRRENSTSRLVEDIKNCDEEPNLNPLAGVEISTYEIESATIVLTHYALWKIVDKGTNLDHERMDYEKEIVSITDPIAGLDYAMETFGRGS
ncbi:hypothetical protein A3L09_10595 (plasmid) [Thermococcus profundus]|uniref:Uncharacterized protein n=1 Tax=Thermococcus profundus TaxID=49899 RepID=A0A2Z2ME40_THEPR|nr:hypothetical protein [Thermococcus profundus]ASJ03799.1 hypothetical protein A3L09_10595 [Thermococcus profundus]